MKRLILVLAVLLLLCLPAPYLINTAADHALRSAIAEACSDCEIHWKSLKVGLGSVTLSGLDFSFGDRRSTEVFGEVHTLQFRFAGLSSHFLHIGAITVDEPVVNVAEGDGKHLSAEDNDTQEQAWRVLCDRIDIHGGSFSYTRLRKLTHAHLSVHDIAGAIDLWDSFEQERWVMGQASGLLEKTGRFLLTIETPIFSPRPEGRVKLEMKGLDLSDLNPFFDTDEGISLSGHLEHGIAEFSYRGRVGSSHVKAAYKDLKVKFHSRKEERGPITAFFSNLLSSLSLKSTKTSAGNGEAPQVLRGNGSVVSFVLRGYRDAALKAAR